MPQLSLLVKTLKKYAINRSVSNEEFVNALLNPFIVAGRITDRYKNEFYLNKSRVSELLNQREDVPRKLRAALQIVGIYEETEKNMPGFIYDYLDEDRLGYLREELSGIYNSNEDAAVPEDYRIMTEHSSIERVLTIILLRSISECNLTDTDNNILLKNGTSKVEIITGDIFRYGFGNRKKKKNIVVIPVNTSFDTHVTRKLEGTDYPLVSENTLHGQWIIRINASGILTDELDCRITESLDRLGFSPEGETVSINSKRIIYPIGSIAIIETDNAIYFLTAISAFDKFNNARSEPAYIENAIRSILELYDRYGQGYDLYIPLIGTGRSRAGLSPSESFNLMKKIFAENIKMINGHVVLVIRPDDREELVTEE